MKNVWRKLRDSWLDFWEDDELDMDKKHLSQHDKRSLLYGGFMIGAVTFVFLSIGIMVGNIWTNHRNQKDMEELLGTIATYMATATDDEYEEIAQTIGDCIASISGQAMAAAAAWDGRIDIEESTALFGIRGGLKAKGISDTIATETMELVQRSYTDTLAAKPGIGAFCRPVTLPGSGGTE